jgi:hypothetical protein
MASGEAMSSPSAADGPAAWDHGLSPVVLKRLRLLIGPFDTPLTLTFNRNQYARLYKASPDVWGAVLYRYALFQQLKRRKGETEATHRARQNCWLRDRRKWELEHRGRGVGKDDLKTMWPDTIGLGTWVASLEEFAGSELELLVPCFPTARVLVLDIASDKGRLMARISELIDRERETTGICSAIRRGPRDLATRKIAAARALFEKEVDREREATGNEPGHPYPELDWRPDPPNSEHREFLRSIQDHHIVPLWDLQLAGPGTDKLAMARVLYPELTNPVRNVSQRSIPRVLLQKIERARELQDQIVGWLPRLLAVVG